MTAVGLGCLPKGRSQAVFLPKGRDAESQHSVPGLCVEAHPRSFRCKHCKRDPCSAQAEQNKTSTAFHYHRRLDGPARAHLELWDWTMGCGEPSVALLQATKFSAQASHRADFVSLVAKFRPQERSRPPCFNSGHEQLRRRRRLHSSLRLRAHDQGMLASEFLRLGKSATQTSG